MAYFSLHKYKWRYGNELFEVMKDRDKKESAEKSLKVLNLNGGDSFPEDLIVEIFSWLPVKTLLQFKSLSKSWYMVIKKPEFVSKHLENYYHNNHVMKCFCTLNLTLTREVNLCVRLVDEALGIYLKNDFFRIPPFTREFEIDGPCNGIYVVNNRWIPKMRALWNPTNNELEVLPPLVIKPDLPTNLTYYHGYDTYGIGFDPLAKDYKVLVIKRYTCDPKEYNSCDCHHPISVLVYSSGTDSWKYWGDVRQPYDMAEKNVCYIFLNECFYLIVTSADRELEQIISLDIDVESLQEIQVPNYEKPAKRSLGVYHDSIAFYSVYPSVGDNDKYFDIWSFNEGCWTKKVTIGPLLGHWHPFGPLKNDKVVLLHCSKLVLCDPETKQMRDIAQDRDWRHCKIKSVVLYMESLVSVRDLASKHATRRQDARNRQ